MLLSGVFTKALRDRWLAPAVTAGLLGAFVVFAMAAYRDIDTSVYDDLPESIRSLMGIPVGADPATLAFNVMIGFAGSLSVAGVAISMGAAAIAGEERNGTIGLLLGNPRSRRHVAVSKAASMLVLTVAATVVLWAASRLAPVLLDLELGETHLAATMLHLGVNALFYGFMALAVGGWSGNRSRASAIPVAVMTVSYFAVGLLPLVEPLADLERAVPWYYFDGSDPLINGVDVRHLAVLTGGIVVFGALALVGLDRRDLRSRTVGVSILDRLRADEHTRRLVERLAGSARVSSPWMKTVSQRQGLVALVSTVMFVLMGVLMGPMYRATEDSVAGLGDDLPEAMMALAGGGDLSTPEGWFQVETFSLMAPIAIMVVTILVGSRAVAGEESDGTMGLLLANPVRRSEIVLQQAGAMVFLAFAVGVATGAGVVVANVVSSLGMSTVGIVATSLLVTLLGLVFGAVALLLSAATGRVAVAAYGAVGAAFVSYLLASLLPLSDDLAGLARFTPNHYYLGSDPLVNGMNWSHAGLLALSAMVFVGLAAIAFERRDVRG